MSAQFESLEAFVPLCGNEAISLNLFNGLICSDYYVDPLHHQNL